MKDLLLDDDFIPQIEDGDFVCGDSTQQHVQCLVKANKGDFKEAPQIGFGIDNYINKSMANLSKFERDLKVELESDGFEDPEISFEDNSLKINV